MRLHERIVLKSSSDGSSDIILVLNLGEVPDASAFPEPLSTNCWNFECICKVFEIMFVFCWCSDGLVHIIE